MIQEWKILCTFLLVLDSCICSCHITILQTQIMGKTCCRAITVPHSTFHKEKWLVGASPTSSWSRKLIAIRKKWSGCSVVNLRMVNGVNRDSVKLIWGLYLVCCWCFDETVRPKHIFADCQVCRCHFIPEATLNNHTYHCIKETA